MGCLSHRRKAVDTRADQKWSYINLCDFKSTSCFPPFAYAYLWLSLLISLAVYGVDTFTAVSLLAFNEWSSKIEPKIDIDIAKWIFSACIVASFINLGFEHIRAWKVMRRGNVAECYLDNLAVRLESIRLGKGQGWRRFLVFAELTKSKKGAEYIALFTYFSFQSWIRVLLCSGPRQVVNAVTLYSVATSELLDETATDIESSVMGIINKIGQIASEDYQQALVLAGMAFTLIVWVFSALFLIAAIFFYIVFLWHWIPRADGGLAGYCERKVNKALVKIVTRKVNKAILKEQESRLKADQKAAKKTGEKMPLERQATLPTIPNVGLGGEGGDKLPEMPTLSRTETLATLPPYASRPGTPGSIELNNMDQKRPLPNRTATMSSSTTYSSRAPLMGGASDMGTNPLSPAGSVPSMDMNNYPPMRPNTAGSQRSFSRPTMNNHLSNNSTSSFSANHHPTNSNSSFVPPRFTETPARFTETPGTPGGGPPFPPPVRSPTAQTVNGYNRPPLPQNSFPRPGPPGRTQYDSFSGSDGRASPAPSTRSNRTGSGAGLPRNPAPAPLNAPGQGGYLPYQPSRSATGPVPYRGPPAPHRNMTAPMPPRQPTGDYFSRQEPSQGSGYGYDYDVEGQRDQRDARY